MNKRLLFYSLLFAGSLTGFSQEADTSKITNGNSPLDTMSNNIPIFILDADGGAGDEAQDQDISGLLQASRDVYLSQVGFNFSFARFRLRGYSTENTSIFLNGMPGNDPETGRAIWAYWGGLNDATRYPEVQTGISTSNSNFGNIGGYSNINLRASDKRKGTKVSYAATNRTYTNRLMLSHNTGMMANGWAFSTVLSGRYSTEGYVDGTYYRGMSYFGAAEKKINDRHSLNLVAFGAPTVQARGGIAVQEAYDLTGNNFYNPYWGYQDGEKRNARVRNNHKPYVLLTDYFKIDDKSKVTTTLYYESGRTGNTNLNWYGANDPRPDYYRYLPSNNYNRGEIPQGDAQTAAWQANDPDVTQINWDDMYNANYKNLYTLENANGSGEDLTGSRSKYILEEYRLDPKRLGINSFYNNKVSEKVYLTAGLNGYMYKSENYRVVKDLLGGDFWVDVDQFAERDFADETVAQNDLNTPNKVVGVGDRFNYDYDLHLKYGEIFGNVDLKLTKKLEGYVGVSVSGTQFWRDGKLQNGKFPETSAGVSESRSFLNYGLKAGALYKINGRHVVSVNVLNRTKAPTIQNSFISPRTRAQYVDGLTSAETISGDINYIVRYPKFQARVTGYYTEMNDQTWSRSFYHDEYNNFINYMMTDVDQLFTGIEIGVQGDVTSTIQLSGAFTTSQSLYNSRPNATITADNSQEVLAENKTIYLKNYRIGGMPQTAGTIGIKYNSPKYWFAGINYNYVTDIYLDPNPDRRTEEALVGYVETDPQVGEIIDQQKLDAGYSVNLFVGKSWRTKNYKFIRANININNLTNNTEFVSGGFEQLRYDITDIGRFPPKLGYAYGLNFFAMISYQF
jgi:hypothetical protein